MMNPTKSPSFIELLFYEAQKDYEATKKHMIAFEPEIYQLRLLPPKPQ